MISSSRMELLELFLPVASNSPTKTFFVMGCKGPISHLFHKRVFQHRTNWSIVVSLQKHQHLVLGEMPQLPKNLCKPLPRKNLNHKAPRFLQPSENSRCSIIRENRWRMGLTYPFKTSLVLLNGFELDFVQKLLNIQCMHGPHGKENPSSWMLLSNNCSTIPNIHDIYILIFHEHDKHTQSHDHEFWIFMQKPANQGIILFEIKVRTMKKGTCWIGPN